VAFQGIRVIQEYQVIRALMGQGEQVDILDSLVNRVIVVPLATVALVGIVVLVAILDSLATQDQE
jgi:hypothetical protein